MEKKFSKSLLSLLLVAVLLVSVTSVTAFAADITATVGEVFKEVVYEGTNIDSVTVNLGRIPDGLVLSYTKTSITVSGIPTTEGNYSFTLNFEDNGEAKEVSTSLTLVAGAAGADNTGKLPTIPKSPTGETVDEGGAASFVARQNNAIWAVWYFISPDGNTYVRYDKIEAKFPGLKIVDGMYATVRVRNIPAALDGWSVACQFSNREGAVMTDAALIKVNAKAAPAAQASPEPTPTPTVEPTATPVPAEQTPAPEAAASEPTPAPSSAPTPVPAKSASANKTAKDYKPLIIICAAAVLAVLDICATILYLNRSRGASGTGYRGRHSGYREDDDEYYDDEDEE